MNGPDPTQRRQLVVGPSADAELLRRLADLAEELRERDASMAEARDAAAELRRRNRRLRSQLDESRVDGDVPARPAPEALREHRKLLAAGGLASVLLAVLVAVTGSGVAGVVITLLAALALCGIAQLWLGVRAVHQLVRGQDARLAEVEQQVRALDRQQVDHGEEVDELVAAVRLAGEQQEQALRDLGSRITLLGRER